MSKRPETRKLTKRPFTIGLTVVAALCVLLRIFGMPPLPNLFPGLQRYANLSAGLEVSYPNNWLLLEVPRNSRASPDVVVTINLPKFTSPGIDVSIARTAVTFTALQEVADWAAQSQARWDNYQEIATSNLHDDGENTLLREFTIQLPKSSLVSDSTLHCLGNYRLHNGHGYVLTLCAAQDEFSQVRATFEQVIRSFRYLE